VSVELVGLAVLMFLGAIAAVEVLIGEGPDGSPVIAIGWEAVAVAGCGAIVAWRRNLALGLLMSILLIAGLRAAGIA
jgi:hypothetical protein